MDPYKFELYEYVDGNLSVEWEWIGEGRSGDFDEADPDDEPLLRANLMAMGPDGEWHQDQDSSYCTYANVDTPQRLLDDASRMLIETVRKHGGIQFDHGTSDPHVIDRKVMEFWTHTEYDVEADQIVVPYDVPYFKHYQRSRER
jgi:hypothetical protein